MSNPAYMNIAYLKTHTNQDGSKRVSGNFDGRSLLKAISHMSQSPTLECWISVDKNPFAKGPDDAQHVITLKWKEKKQQQGGYQQPAQQQQAPMQQAEQDDSDLPF